MEHKLAGVNEVMRMTIAHPYHAPEAGAAGEQAQHPFARLQSLGGTRNPDHPEDSRPRYQDEGV